MRRLHRQALHPIDLAATYQLDSPEAWPMKPLASVIASFAASVGCTAARLPFAAINSSAGTRFYFSSFGRCRQVNWSAFRLNAAQKGSLLLESRPKGSRTFHSPRWPLQHHSSARSCAATCVHGRLPYGWSQWWKVGKLERKVSGPHLISCAHPHRTSLFFWCAPAVATATWSHSVLSSSYQSPPWSYCTSNATQASGPTFLCLQRGAAGLAARRGFAPSQAQPSSPLPTPFHTALPSIITTTTTATATTIAEVLHCHAGCFQIGQRSSKLLHAPIVAISASSWALAAVN